MIGGRGKGEGGRGKGRGREGKVFQIYTLGVDVSITTQNFGR